MEWQVAQKDRPSFLHVRRDAWLFGLGGLGLTCIFVVLLVLVVVVLILGIGRGASGLLLLLQLLLVHVLRQRPVDGGDATCNFGSVDPEKS